MLIKFHHPMINAVAEVFRRSPPSLILQRARKSSTRVSFTRKIDLEWSRRGHWCWQIWNCTTWRRLKCRGPSICKVSRHWQRVWTHQWTKVLLSMLPTSTITSSIRISGMRYSLRLSIIIGRPCKRTCQYTPSQMLSMSSPPKRLIFRKIRRFSPWKNQESKLKISTPKRHKEVTIKALHNKSIHKIYMQEK